MEYSIGDRVQWSSQASGTVKVKQGAIIEIIAIGSRPSKDKYPRLYRGRDVGSSRDHESYVVKVEKEFYWPRTGALSRVGTRIQSTNESVESTNGLKKKIDFLKELSGSLVN